MEDKKERRSIKKALYISSGVLAIFLVTGLVLIISGVISTDFFNYSAEEQDNDYNSFETEEEEITMVETEDGLVFEKNTENGLEDELERTDLILEGFPEEILLSGGTVLSSSDTGMDISVAIEVNATAQETFNWYVNNFAEQNSEIINEIVTEHEDGSFESSFEYSFVQMDENDGQISIRGTVHVTQSPLHQSPTVTIRYFLD